MGKLPQVTIGEPTAQRVPRASLGTPSAQRGAQRIPQVVDNKVKLGDAYTETGAQTPSLVIKELNGPRRQVTLRGRALPFRGSVKFAVEQNIDEGKYTGYPRKNQTVLGATEADTEMNGVWHDRFIGDADDDSVAFLVAFADTSNAVSEDNTIDIGFAQSKLRTAKDLVDIFEDIAYNGRALRVTWAHIVRLGRIARFEHTWLNLHDVEWKVTFKWIGRDEQVGLPSPARTTLVGVSEAFRAAATDVHDATNFDGLTELSPSFADRVDVIVGRVEGAIAEMTNAVEQRIESVSNTVDALRRGLAIAAFVRDQAQNLLDTFDAIAYPAMLALQDPGTVVPDGLTFEALSDVDIGRANALIAATLGVPVGKAMAAACQNRAAVRLARKMKHVAARQRFAAIRQLEAESLGAVILRDHQDLRDLAAEWYGNPEDWEQIRKFNGLSTVSPPAGTMVFIPSPGTVA